MDVDRWHKLIDSPEASDRIEAADVLPDSDITPDIVKQLLKVLADENALARTCAADALGCVPSPDVRTALHARLEIEDDPLTQAFLFSSLGAMGNPVDAPLLDAALQRADSPTMRSHAAYGLLLSCVAPAMQALVETCRNDDHKARATAFSQLNGAMILFQDMASAAASVAAERQDLAESEPERESIRILLASISTI